MHLGLADFLLQNHFARTEIASFRRPHRFFTHIGHRLFIHGIVAFWAGTEFFLTGEIDFFGTFAFIVAKVKRRRMVLVELDDGGERTPHLAAKALQRPHLALAQQLLHFFGFPLTASDHFP